LVEIVLGQRERLLNTQQPTAVRIVTGAAHHGDDLTFGGSAG